MQKISFVVQHMEEYLYQWSAHEYVFVSQLIGASALQFVITNSTFTDYSGPHRQDNLAQLQFLKSKMRDNSFFSPNSICDLVRQQTFQLGNQTYSPKDVCLLDMRGSNDLSCQLARPFRVFVIGGILGDHPPKDRAKNLRQAIPNYFRLGQVQLPTDVAVQICYQILVEGNRFQDLPLIDQPVFKGKNSKGQPSSVQMKGFRYLGKEGRPRVSEGVLRLILEDFDLADFM